MKLTVTCSICKKVGTYETSKEENVNLKKYWSYGNKARYLQELFPNIPAWIRSGMIDTRSNGFCICPECSG